MPNQLYSKGPAMKYNNSPPLAADNTGMRCIPVHSSLALSTRMVSLLSTSLVRKTE